MGNRKYSEYYYSEEHLNSLSNKAFETLEKGFPLSKESKICIDNIIDTLVEMITVTYRGISNHRIACSTYYVIKQKLADVEIAYLKQENDSLKQENDSLKKTISDIQSINL